MIPSRVPRQIRFAPALLALLLVFPAPRAFAVNKDMVQLQTQVQQLQDAVARLQQSNDERMGVLKDLVQQSADSVNKMASTIQTLQQQMRTQQEASGSKLDQVSGQVQSLNDSVDEVKARLNSLEKALQSVQNQQQSINATLQNLTPPAISTNPAGPGSGPGVAPGDTQAPPMATTGRPAGDSPFAATQGPPITPRPPAGGPPISDLYKTALNDYMAAKYPLATTEFGQVISTNPSDPLAGNAYYYLGEIDYRAGKFAAAVKDYDHVLDEYPSNQKIAVSRLHKAQALLAMKQRDAGIAELRGLIQRYPNSPEASQARTRLRELGVPAVAKR